MLAISLTGLFAFESLKRNTTSLQNFKGGHSGLQEWSVLLRNKIIRILWGGLRRADTYKARQEKIFICKDYSETTNVCHLVCNITKGHF